uniref:Mini-chromosome maintenance complex-binding protein n=1 Tax=Anopheles quadriannulatus TaxID=34691 RepID=A0A182XF44_ANOQN
MLGEAEQQLRRLTDQHRHRSFLRVDPALDGTGNNTGMEEFECNFTEHETTHPTAMSCLFGDGVASDYMICHLVLSVYKRDYGESEVLSGYTRSLYGLFEVLLPASHFLSITHENMNTIPSQWDYINQIDYNADLPVLVLSERKSMLPSNCYLPIVPNAETIKQINKTIEATRHNIAPKINDMRHFLTIA